MTTPNSNTTESLPLHNKWVLWYDNPRQAAPGASWKENLKYCGEFDTAENFWRIFNNVKPASQLSTNSNYHIFKKGVEPMWEDPMNAKGGKWVLTIPKKESKAGRCDEWWLHTVLAVVGETLDETGDIVCGCVVSIRKSQDRIALWLRSNQFDLAVKTGQRWKRALEVSSRTVLKYQSHQDAAASGSSFKNEVKFEV
uniref:mRNA cap-binding protein n=1 Tax=Leptocylindrus danicus TaxID=163516 RepID=A0A7S2JX99_9STRA|mmetsp:Transcript_12079/g.18223  ORF Transcript_12079/g.18223 Transcript_12079/m.18223 type:complete len:197 (+) Transcript_12079:61-651(+)|eukprot:CAMPEP_0116033654 /NCGR_PEP_ID=MMETSP0321-20121206/19130_1 /TAXON_ID=163516 /ORGANISM="Leptocylindrus danicus var. danicus, Strain B650" /LENGTH=196 /DNA_ID=CAMNT_0003509795 /DNA_START=28 /DNA_END=618 /DNA_ORIENTATION=+